MYHWQRKMIHKPRSFCRGHNVERAQSVITPQTSATRPHNANLDGPPAHKIPFKVELCSQKHFIVYIQKC